MEKKFIEEDQPKKLVQADVRASTKARAEEIMAQKKPPHKWVQVIEGLLKLYIEKKGDI